MRIKGELYVSYKTHSYCSSEERWIPKSEVKGAFCPYCGLRLRNNSHNTKSRADRWDNAY